MSAKRFTNIEHDYENAWIKCNDDGDFMIYAIYKELDESLPSLEDLLNGLHEENKELKKENEQLKSALKELKEIGDYQDCRIKELYEENEQLKHLIQEAYNNEKTELGKSVLKQLQEAIQ